MLKVLNRKGASKKGASIVEYGLLTGLVAIVSIASLVALGRTVADSFTSTAHSLRDNRDTVVPEGPEMRLTFTVTSGNLNATLPLEGAASLTIDWGDATANAGCPTTFSSAGGTNGNTTCAYGSPGTYTVTIDGTLERFGTMSGPQENIENLVSVDSWGTLGITSLENAFWDATNLTSVPSNLPSTVTRMKLAFRGTWGNYDVSQWDVTNVEDTGGMFRDTVNFNADLSQWNVSSLKDASLMFRGASAFNQPLNSWNLASIENINKMFLNATQFNQDLNSWNLATLTTANQVFDGATNFNGDISAWRFPLVTNVSGMFKDAVSFNGNITSWEMGNVQNFSSMFENATAFDQDLTGWCTTSYTNNTSFALNSPIASNGKTPSWGTCP